MAGQTSDKNVAIATTAIDPRKRADQVRDKLVALIREGQIAEGEKLPTEAQLSEMFGVGRSTVREAVQSLTGLGLIETRPGRGSFVRHLSLNDLVEMVAGTVRLEYGPALQVHEVRAMIEITAARMAAVRRTDDDLARINEAILRYRIAVNANDPAPLIDADLAFHRAVIGATHNAMMVNLLDSIAGMLREHRQRYGVANELASRPVVIAEHDQIAAAIAAGDPALAARRMQHHMQLIWQRIEQLAMEEDAASDRPSYLPLYEDDETTT